MTEGNKYLPQHNNKTTLAIADAAFWFSGSEESSSIINHDTIHKLTQLERRQERRTAQYILTPTPGLSCQLSSALQEFVM